MSKHAGRTGHHVGYDAASSPSITHSMRVVGESAAEARAEARIDATLVPIGGVRTGATSAWPRHGPPTKQRQLGLKMAGAASKGGRGRVLELFAPRRLLVPDLRPRCHRVVCGSGLRYARRARRLTPTEESVIRALASTKSLRSLAADFGVSHETVRAVIQGQKKAGQR